jgi:hypothetical protein
MVRMYCIFRINTISRINRLKEIHVYLPQTS